MITIVTFPRFWGHRTNILFHFPLLGSREVRSRFSVKMFISSEEQILFGSDDTSETLKPTLLNSNPDSAAPPEFSDSPPVSTTYTDVGVIPEHEKNELEQLISNLESIMSRPSTFFFFANLDRFGGKRTLCNFNDIDTNVWN